MNTINDTQATETTSTCDATEIVEIAATEIETVEPKSTHNKYPFPTKREIVTLLGEDEVFRHECVGVINARQTAHEQATLTTRERNRGGWMSSDAVRMGRVAQKLAALETLSGDEEALVAARIPSYAKQLAAHFRAEAVENNPALAETAAAFFKS
jgi:hypothetical protein